MQGDFQQAKVALEQARTEAENLESRRLLWQIIATLAELEADKGLSMGLSRGACNRGLHRILCHAQKTCGSLPALYYGERGISIKKKYFVQISRQSVSATLASLQY